MASASDELVGVLDQLASDRWVASEIWPAMFDTTNDNLTRAMRTDSPLRLSGLLQATGRHVQFACVSRFWVDLLAKNDSLFDALLEPVSARIGSGRPARLSEEDLTFATRLLRNANEPGVNLLLYEAVSLDERRLLSIISAAERTGWRVRKFEDAPRDVLPSLTFVAFQLLACNTKNAVLVVEQPSEVLHTSSHQLIRSLFVSADVKLTHLAEVKLTHLGKYGGHLSRRYVDPGASSGSSSSQTTRALDSLDCAGDGRIA